LSRGSRNFEISYSRCGAYEKVGFIVGESRIRVDADFGDNFDFGGKLCAEVFGLDGKGEVDGVNGSRTVGSTGNTSYLETSRISSVYSIKFTVIARFNDDSEGLLGKR